MFAFLASLCFLFNTCNEFPHMSVFSTKTLYKWAHGTHATVLDNPADHVTTDDLICSARFMNMVIRHGARYPTLSNMNKIIELHKKIVDHKSPETFPELDRWIFKYDMVLEGELVAEGVDEQYFLGARVGSRFHALIQANKEHIQFVSSKKSRAIKSAESFHGGLARNVLGMSSFKVQVNDLTMRFYDGCFNYEKHVKENKTNMKEFFEYETTSDFLRVINSVKTKLEMSVELTAEDIYLISDLCSYETYISNITIWCDILTDEEKVVLEYGKDIKAYYEMSYGHPFNLKLACPLVSDIFKGIDNAIQGMTSGNGSHEFAAVKLQFGHAETVIPLLTALELFKDPEPLLATNKDALAERLFKTSKISPFSTNFAVVVYVCDEKSNINDKFLVKFFVNEIEVLIPACGSSVCPYHKVRAAYKDLIDNCHIKQKCSFVKESVTETTKDDPNFLLLTYILALLTAIIFYLILSSPYIIAFALLI